MYRELQSDVMEFALEESPSAEPLDVPDTLYLTIIPIPHAWKITMNRILHWSPQQKEGFDVPNPLTYYYHSNVFPMY